MKVKSYKELDVWKNGLSIVDLVYELTSQFPSTERVGLAGQMQRAAVSIPSNVAEGFVRQHTGEYRQFCHVALGDCAELETQAIVASHRAYISAGELTRLAELLDHESRMLMNLIKTLRS